MAKQEMGQGSNREAQEEKPLYAQEISAVGYSAGKFSGPVFLERYLVVDDDSEVDNDSDRGRIYDMENDTFVDDASIKDQIEKVRQENKAIIGARQQRAKELASGNADLEKALLLNMDYKNGDVGEPLNVSGIDFYQVGRNASHFFFVGVKDGKKYRLAFLPEAASEPGSGDDLSKAKELGLIKEVEDWEDGYYGHY